MKQTRLLFPSIVANMVLWNYNICAAYYYCIYVTLLYVTSMAAYFIATGKT